MGGKDSTSQVDIMTGEKTEEYADKKGGKDLQRNPQKREALRDNIRKLEIEISRLRDEIADLTYMIQNEDVLSKKNQNMLKRKKLREDKAILEEELAKLIIEETELTAEINAEQYYDKYVLIRNVRNLSKNSSVKLGQIEKAANLSTGYISRLANTKNNTEPPLGFLVVAARMLNVPMDYLIKSDPYYMDNTTDYTLKFLIKLMEDTYKGRCVWDVEREEDLSNIKSGTGFKINHPLFIKNANIDRTSYIPQYVFNSRIFGVMSYINGDCFKVDIGKGARLYIMSVAKAEHELTDEGMVLSEAREIWIVTADGRKQYICSNVNSDILSATVDELYNVATDYISQPQLDNDVLDIIDSYMNQ